MTFSLIAQKSCEIRAARVRPIQDRHAPPGTNGQPIDILLLSADTMPLIVWLLRPVDKLAKSRAELDESRCHVMFMFHPPSKAKADCQDSSATKTGTDTHSTQPFI